MMKQSVPSASLLMIQNQKERLIHQKAVLPFRGTSTGWRNGPTETSRSLTKGSAKSSTWGGTTPGTSTGWGPPS